MRSIYGEPGELIRGGWDTSEIPDQICGRAIIKREEAGMILEKLNRAHRKIEFAIEIEKEGETPFRDFKIIRE